MDTRSQQDETRAGSTGPTGEPPHRNVDDQAPVWLQRASLAMLVVTCIYLGLLLVFLPWTRYWQENRFLLLLPQGLAVELQTGAARGFVSGLGLLDVWIGIGELGDWRRRRKLGRRTLEDDGHRDGHR
jgi:hypothetical protein